MDQMSELLASADQLLWNGEDEAARELYEQATKGADPGLKSENAPLIKAYLGLGISLTNLDRYAEAEHALRRAIFLLPDGMTRIAITRAHAILHAKQRSISVAMTDLNAAVQMVPERCFAERGITFSTLGLVVLNDGRLLEALYYYGAADALLQRGDNSGYELENLLRFIRALTLNGEDDFAHRLAERAALLALDCGSTKKQAETAELISKLNQ